MSQVKALPLGWKWVKLGDVCKLRNGYAFKSSDYKDIGIPIIRISDINGRTVLTKKAVRIKAHIDFEEYTVENGNILVAMSGATTGKFGIYKSNEKAYQNQRVGNFVITKTDQLEKQFLFHQIDSLKRKIEQDAYGGAQPNISSKKIEEMEIVLPPLSIQTQIVEKLEALLSELDKGKAQLLTAQAQLKTYRQAVLKYAFEGKLTGDTEGWQWVKLGEVIEKIEAGKSFKCDERPPNKDETGVLKVSAVSWGEFDEMESKTVVDNDKINQNYFVKKGDFLFSRANTLELVGATVIVKTIKKRLMLSDKTLRFLFNQKVDKNYVLFYLKSRKGRFEIQRLSSGNQDSMRNIGQGRINQIEFPLPPLSTQQKIVTEIESRLSVCDKLEETLKVSLAQCETLRQSLLKRAFEGKLV